MTVLERRVRVATAILNDLDERDFSEIEQLFKSLKKRQKPEPCMYTMEEIRESVMQRKTDFEAGKIDLIPHEQVKKRSIS